MTNHNKTAIEREGKIVKTETGAIIFEGSATQLYRIFAIEQALKSRATTGLILMKNLTLTKLRRTDPEKVGNAKTYQQAYENWKAWTDKHIRNQTKENTK